MPVVLITAITNKHDSKLNAAVFCKESRDVLKADARAISSLKVGQWYDVSDKAAPDIIMNYTNSKLLSDPEIPFPVFLLNQRDSVVPILRVYILPYEKPAGSTDAIIRAYSSEIGNVWIPNDIENLFEPGVIYRINTLRIRSPQDRERYGAGWAAYVAHLNVETGCTKVQANKKHMLAEMTKDQSAQKISNCASENHRPSPTDENSCFEATNYSSPQKKAVIAHRGFTEILYSSPSRTPQKVARPFKLNLEANCWNSIEPCFKNKPLIPRWQSLERQATDQLKELGIKQFCAVTIKCTKTSAVFFHALLGYLFASAEIEGMTKLATGYWAYVDVVVQKNNSKNPAHVFEVQNVLKQVDDPHPTHVIERDGKEMLVVRLNIEIEQADTEVNEAIRHDSRLQELCNNEQFHAIFDHSLGYIAMPQELFKQFNGQRIDCVLEALPLKVSAQEVLYDYFAAFVVVEVFGPANSAEPFSSRSKP